jgi:transcriptional regulator with XRE-family HTH domain
VEAIRLDEMRSSGLYASETLETRVGSALRRIRDTHGFTQKEAGANAQRDPAWISNIETGKMSMRIRDVQRALMGSGARFEDLLEEMGYG